MTPGIPGLPLPARRPPVSNPPPRELDTPVRVSYGRAQYQGPVLVLVLLALLCLIGYLATRRAPNEDTSAIVRDVREQMALQTEAMSKLERELTHRLDNVETKIDRLQDSQDRVRERVTTLEGRH